MTNKRIGRQGKPRSKKRKKSQLASKKGDMEAHNATGLDVEQTLEDFDRIFPGQLDAMS
ncbi:MAG TPA: hypothetical protein VM286_08665 [Candidatus Thermoplasmatota archaeon]|nr:hypothetical protein [Candidatus Thermoplasmatota archaeon]